MTLQTDVTGWLGQLGQIIGAAGSSVLLLKIVERFFRRDDREAQDRVRRRTEARDEIARLTKRVDELDARLDKAHDEYNDLYRIHAQNAAQLEQITRENIALRARYHDAMQVLQRVIAQNDTYRVALGKPESEAIRIPTWLYQRVPGPTESRATDDDGEDS